VIFRAARGVVAMLLVATAACAQSVEPGPSMLPRGGRLLFVGNSLTAGNRLADMVAALASASPFAWQVGSVAIGGASLADHIGEGTASRRLRDERWDVVVLQQGPSTLPASRADLRASTVQFQSIAAAAGTRVALYMVWPDSTWSAPRFASDFDRIRDAYALAAHDVGGTFIPAGEAWRVMLAAHPEVPLYGPDQFHPTPEGTYLAALTIVARLSGRDPVGLPDTLTRNGATLIALPPARARALQEAARAAVATYGNYVPPDAP